ncbi:MAG: glycosyltransferase family 4 protein [Candidatus Daviesbacteria bacterium]|nr:glycosyltransferase family 4 protein [Candidatus Daviesbacteria bacterium]
MKIAIYSPYLDTFGGGEKYMMTIAEALVDHQVEVCLDRHLNDLGNDYLKNKLQERFNLNLTNVSFIKAPLGRGASALERSLFLKRYDLLFYLTDGSIFYPTSKKNILHIQSPLIGQPAKSLWGKIKLKGWDLIIYNSHFTEEHSRKMWPIKSEVVYPPVDVNKIKTLKKKKYILSVGRFFGYLKDKKHEVIIKSFKKIYESKGLDDWSLHLVGSAGEGDGEYLQQLKDLARGLPVNFYPNLSYDKLIKLYGESLIYWHAAGFGEDDPTKMEHFGITTVEAMAGGCVPVVIGKGGQMEIVENGKSGLLWNSLEELENLTLKLIKDENLWQKMSGEAQVRALNFNKDKFKQKILTLI